MDADFYVAAHYASAAAMARARRDNTRKKQRLPQARALLEPVRPLLRLSERLMVGSSNAMIILLKLQYNRTINDNFPLCGIWLREDCKVGFGAQEIRSGHVS